MEGHHPVKEEEVLALLHHFTAPFALGEDRQLAEMSVDELPSAVFGSGGDSEAFLQAAVRLVSGDDEILFGCGIDCLLKGSLLLVQCADVGDDEAGSAHGLLDRIPDGVLRIVEYDGNPTPRFQHAAALFEALLHQVLVVKERFVSRSIHDRFGFAPRHDTVPRFDKIVEVGVVDVLSERRISKDVVDGTVSRSEIPALRGGHNYGSGTQRT